jgi:pimeloyl-ACP methyl ester carboxylesterase
MPHVAGVSHRTVEARGVRFHVAEAGEGDGIPILLVAGWPQHWYAWRKLVPLLAPERKLYLLDLRGFGWSDAPPGAYEMSTLADDQMAVMDALGLERVDLIAHDWGAWIGFRACLAHPERFAHYLSLSMLPPWPDPPSPRAIPVLLRLWYQVVLATPGLGRGLMRHTPLVKRIIPTGAVQPDVWTAEDLEAFAAPLREPARAQASSRLYRSFLTRELPRLLRDTFADTRLTVPTLLMLGAKDPAIDHRRLGPWQAHADDMRVEVREDSAHFIPEELPEVVAGRARELFARAS